MNSAPSFSAYFKIVAIAAVASVTSLASAQIQTLSSGNSSVSVNFGSQAGMYQWTINGQNQLAQQWFWYGVGDGALASIDTLGTPVVSVSGNSVDAVYTGATFGIDLTYTLQGSPSGQWTSDVTENISIYNLSAAPLDFHFYQYSDFALAGTPGAEQSTIYINNDNFFTKANVTKAANQLSETIDQPLANHGEADIGTNTLSRLNSGTAYRLNDSTIAGPDPNLDATWALEWDFTLGEAGSSTDTMNVIKDKKLSVAPTPEPSCFGLGMLGLGAFILRRKK